MKTALLQLYSRPYKCGDTDALESFCEVDIGKLLSTFKCVKVSLEFGIITGLGIPLKLHGAELVENKGAYVGNNN